MPQQVTTQLIAAPAGYNVLSVSLSRVMFYGIWNPRVKMLIIFILFGEFDVPIDLVPNFMVHQSMSSCKETFVAANDSRAQLKI